MAIRGIDDRLVDFIREESERSGYQLVDIRTRGGGGVLLEVFVDKDGGITLDECSDLNARIRSWIEDQGISDEGLTIDVCSPGLDRELKSDTEYKWAQGKQVKVNTHEPVEDVREFTGRLVEGEADGIALELEDGKTVNIAKTNISKAKLQVTL